MQKDDHIMKHDGIYIAYLAIICTILGVFGSTMAFQA